MSQGVPVLYTKGQGFDGQFEEGEAGFAVVCGNVRQQAKKIEAIAEGYAERSARCVELAKRYEWSLIADRLLRLYGMI